MSSDYGRNGRDSYGSGVNTTAFNTTNVIAWVVVAIGLIPIVGKTLFAGWRLVSRIGR
jgi:hypothetical protein